MRFLTEPLLLEKVDCVRTAHRRSFESGSLRHYADRISSLEFGAVEQESSERCLAVTRQPVLRRIVEMANHVPGPINIDVIDRAKRAAFASYTNCQAPEVEGLNIHLSHIEAGVPQHGDGYQAVTVDIEAVRFTARLDIDGNLFRGREAGTGISQAASNPLMLPRSISFAASSKA